MFQVSLKLVDPNRGVNHVIRRFIGHKKRMRLKMLRDKSYTPWRSAEVVQEIEETLNTPYKQIVPSNAVKRVSETNPGNHSYEDIGKFYTLPEADKMRYFQLLGFPKKFDDSAKVFNETSLMIRRPALEIIEYMKNANYDKLPAKYVIYGEDGCGKRITRIHVSHYAFLNGFVVLDFSAVSNLYRFRKKEVHISETRPPLVDVPLDGAVILKRFQLQNGPVINDLKLKTTKEYVWNSRESTPAGAPLMDLVNYGINRVKYSCDCIDGLVDELKVAANEKQIKLLLSIDGFNSFLAGHTMYVIDSKRDVDTRRLSLYQSLLRFFEPDWCNGAILTTVSEVGTIPKYRGSYFPFFLLRREGFEILDPFIPVEVPKLSDLEFHSLLDYFEDRRWISRTGGREELEYLTARVPAEIMKVVSGI